MKNRISVQVATKDRHTELALVLQSLLTSTYKEWDLIILDDSSGAPIMTAYFINSLLSKIKLEGHRVKIMRNAISFGCCSARNKLIEEDKFNNPLTLRLDDDVIVKEDYIEKLVEVIDKGYDMVTGVIPHLGVPVPKRNTKFVKPIINKKEFDKEGNLIRYDDNCGYMYIEDEIILTSEFRTNCLYKSEINKKIKYPDTLSFVAFREEAFFSIKAILEGYKIAVRTGAIAWHFGCPSGGNRCSDYQEKVKLDNETFYKWMKLLYQKHGNFLEEYYKNGIYKRT